MSDHTKHRAFELADEVVVLVYVSHLGFLNSEMIKDPGPEDQALVSPQRGVQYVGCKSELKCPSNTA